jgi:DNA-directed RNA polymerase II subunit RPB9
MSSPAASATGERKNPAEQITFRFCSECSNMLYPKEDEVDRKLMFTCRTCNFSEEATSSCIFRNAMNNAAGETAGVTQDVGSDPTVGSPSLLDSHGDVSGRRGSGSSGLSSSSNASSASSGSACISTCLSCGCMIICDTCGDHFSMLAADSGTPELELDKASLPGADRDVDMLDGDDLLDVSLDDVEIVPWSGDSLDELGLFMSRQEDMFGLGAVDFGTDQKPETILMPDVLQAQVASALVQGYTS